MLTLDLTEIAPENRLAKIVEVYLSLAESEELIVSSKNSFFDLVGEFQQEFWGQFDWMPMTPADNSKDPVEIFQGKFIKRKKVDVVDEDILHFMKLDHAHCDEFYVQGEEALLAGDLNTGAPLMNAFILCTERHFQMEETIFFPTFEEQTGMSGGPTQVMRMEHQQMRNILAQMKSALANQDGDLALGVGETLLILMQQHNAKEEGMLYPMADVHIKSTSLDMLKKMQLLDVSAPSS